jgi:integrase/recombinase XerD
MQRRLKTVAARAGMDPDACWLHKFRVTFATHALQGGIDLRRCKPWMGHTDLASTMRYLRPARGEKVQAQVEALWA